MSEDGIDLFTPIVENVIKENSKLHINTSIVERISALFRDIRMSDDNLDRLGRILRRESAIIFDGGIEIVTNYFSWGNQMKRAFLKFFPFSVGQDKPIPDAVYNIAYYVQNYGASTMALHSNSFNEWEQSINDFYTFWQKIDKRIVES